MKAFKYLLIALFGCLVGILGYSVFLEEKPIFNLGFKTTEKLEVADQAPQSPLDVEISSINELLDIQKAHEDLYSIDSTFRQMPLTTLVNVAKVVQKNNRVITIRKLIEEYNYHKDVYDPLSSPTSSVDIVPGIPPTGANKDSPEAKVDSTSPSAITVPQNNNSTTNT